MAAGEEDMATSRTKNLFILLTNFYQRSIGNRTRKMDHRVLLDLFSLRGILAGIRGYFFLDTNLEISVS